MSYNVSTDTFCRQACVYFANTKPKSRKITFLLTKSAKSLKRSKYCALLTIPHNKDKDNEQKKKKKMKLTIFQSLLLIDTAIAFNPRHYGPGSGNNEDRDDSGNDLNFGDFFNPFPDDNGDGGDNTEPVPVPVTTPMPVTTPIPASPMTQHPTSVPTERPTPVPTELPTDVPEEDRTDGSDGTVTVPRTSRHQFQWGTIYEGCDYDTPPAVIKCDDGGILTILEMTRCTCDQLSLDYIQCFVDAAEDDDAIVAYTCTGTSSDHLTSTAEIFPSIATECGMNYPREGETGPTGKGGNVVVFGTLGRYCTDPTTGTAMVLENQYTCTEGIPTPDSSNQALFCAAGDLCLTSCTDSHCSCDTDVDGIVISNPDSIDECSVIETGTGYDGFEYSPANLASYNVMEWTYSDAAMNCDWSVPDLTLACSNGGTVRMATDYTFCTELNDGTATCTNPDPDSREARVSLDIHAWCIGTSEDQLELTASLPSLSNVNAFCIEGGLAVQGIRLARACGAFGSDDFELLTNSNFCVDGPELHTSSNLCWGGDECQQETCTTVTVPSILVSAIGQQYTNCIYAA